MPLPYAQSLHGASSDQTSRMARTHRPGSKVLPHHRDTRHGDSNRLSQPHADGSECARMSQIMPCPAYRAAHDVTRTAERSPKVTSGVGCILTGPAALSDLPTHSDQIGRLTCSWRRTPVSSKID